MARASKDKKTPGVKKASGAKRASGAKKAPVSRRASGAKRAPKTVISRSWKPSGWEKTPEFKAAEAAAIKELSARLQRRLDFALGKRMDY